jgi:hypothetical protein
MEYLHEEFRFRINLFPDIKPIVHSTFKMVLGYKNKPLSFCFPQGINSAYEITMLPMRM